MRLLSFLPATEQLVNGEQSELGEIGRILCGYFLIARTVEVAGGNFLAFVCVEVIGVSFRDFRCAVFRSVLIHKRDRGLGQNALGRINDFKLIVAEFFQSEVAFVLLGEQDVADAALREGGCGTSRAGIKHWHILVDAGYE